MAKKKTEKPAADKGEKKPIPLLPTLEVARELYLAKLESSGFTEEQANALGFQLVYNTKLKHEAFPALSSLYIPYIDPFTGLAMRARPKWPAFYRVRFLQEYEPKYSQPPETGVCAYFPCFGVDWKKIALDPGYPIVITEGELKAAKSTIEGVACIGLGGVWSFKCSKLGETFLPELENINWIQRTVTLVFDSDIVRKKDVAHALHALAKELMDRGAIVMIAFLPDILNNGKTGIDDFIISEGMGEYRRILNDAIHFSISRHLFAMNEKFTYVMSSGFIVNKSDGTVYTSAHFHEAITGLVQEKRISKDGDIIDVPVPISKAWMVWPIRAVVDDMTFMPGRPAGGISERNRIKWNTWPGEFGVTPEPGDVSLFTGLVDTLFSQVHPDAKEWFLRWLAYPLQNPGAKLHSSVIMHSYDGGTGKTIIGEMMEKIYGRGFRLLNPSVLFSEFTDWQYQTQFVMVDDLSSDNAAMRKNNTDRLKKYVTQPTATINRKYVPAYEVPDCANYYITTNRTDALIIDEGDRRFFIHSIDKSVRRLGIEFFERFGKWKGQKDEIGPGPAAVMHYLLNIAMGTFNPLSHAYRTEMRAEAVADNKSDAEVWIENLVINPDEVLKEWLTSPEQYITAKQLYYFFDPEGRYPIHGQTFGNFYRTIKKVLQEIKEPVFVELFKDGLETSPPGLEKGRYFLVRSKKLRVVSSNDSPEPEKPGRKKRSLQPVPGGLPSGPRPPRPKKF